MSIASEIQRIQTAKANIKSAIENKGVTVGDGTIDTYAEKISEISAGGSGGYEQGFEDGKNSVVDLGKLCESISFKSLNVFGKGEVTLDLENLSTLDNTFYENRADEVNVTVEHITINCLNSITSMASAFRTISPYDYTLKRITLNAKLQDEAAFNYAFANRRTLEVIDGEPLNFLNARAIANLFQACNALVEFRVVSNSISANFNVSPSPNLSTDTIRSIIDGLADLTGGTAQTLTVHKTVGGKLTDEQKATITAKNWTLVY